MISFLQGDLSGGESLFPGSSGDVMSEFGAVADFGGGGVKRPRMDWTPATVLSRNDLDLVLGGSAREGPASKSAGSFDMRLPVMRDDVSFCVLFLILYFF